MKILYNPFFMKEAFITQDLWDTVATGDAGLLEQLLMRAGMPQTIADEEDKDDTRIAPYGEALQAQADSPFADSLAADRDGTAKQLLQWRDMLVMAGWKAEMTINSKNAKLRVLSACDEAISAYPSKADRWRQVLDKLQKGKEILQKGDTIEVHVPTELIHPIIKAVLDLLHAEYKMEKRDAVLETNEHECTIITPYEQYEGWQLLPMLPYDKETMLVCADEKRLIDTMTAIGGKNWRADRVGCPHCAPTIFDQVEPPRCLVWLDCAGNDRSMYPYDFLTKNEITELEKYDVKFVSREQRATAEAQWLFSLMNRIDKWVLVAPKCHQGESLGEHPVITSIKQDKAFYAAACKKGEEIALPTKEVDIIKLEQIEELHIAPHRATGENILQPSDSYSTIETLVDKPIDYVLEKLGGLSAPEDDEEPNEHMMMGNVAHKVVELLVNKDSGGAYSITEIKQRFKDQFESLYKEAMEKEPEAAAFLTLEENQNMLAVFKDELHESITKLIAIIEEKRLTPLQCEYEVNTPFGPFKNPHGFVDMLLEDKDEKLVIFDFKWSSRDVYQKGLKNGEAYQLYMYKRAVEAQTKRQVAWYAYYLFPMMELYEEPEDIQPQWEEWLRNRTAQLEQIDNGTIAYYAKKDEYPKHLILKNRNLQ